MDVVPTVYDLLGIEPPAVIKGYTQSPIEGESFAAALTDPNAPGKQTQFYAMLGQRSIYHDGWLACTVHPPISGWGTFELDEWELYDLEHDRSQSKNVADAEPVRLETLKSLWFYYAGIYNGLPLDDRSALEQMLAERPHGAPDRQQYIYYPHVADVPEAAGVAINGRSYTIAAGSRDRLRRGSRCAVRARWRRGWPQPLRQGQEAPLHLQLARHQALRHRRRRGHHSRLATSSPPSSPSTGQNTDPTMPGFTGTLTLYVDTTKVGEGEIITQPGNFCLVGDGICVGRDSASPVTPEYTAPFAFTGGTIDKVVVDVSGEKFVDHEAQVAAWFSKD